MKKLLALLLAMMMLVTAVACTDMGEDPNDSVVVNIGVEAMTYTDAATGDVYTYDYLNSTSIVITDFTSANYEPHAITIPDTITVVTKKEGSGTSTEMDMTVTAIGDQAFYAMSNISEVNFNSSLTSIGAFAFANCESLDNVVLPASLTEIGQGAFFSCDKLTTITLNNGLTAIGDSAFYSCAVLENVTIPASVTEIGVAAFSDCIAMTEIVLPEGVKNVGKFAFYNCTAVESVTLPASIEKIGLYSFSTQLRGRQVETEEEGVFETVDVVFNTVEGSYAAEYIANPPTAEDVESEGQA
ncbi:MAG: leucine-rich repeat domain-containing protein [Clostridia bacterium]|nr:leucine-rich repeat domain-containing protein [Clostridia bacterium]